MLGFLKRAYNFENQILVTLSNIVTTHLGSRNIIIKCNCLPSTFRKSCLCNYVWQNYKKVKTLKTIIYTHSFQFNPNFIFCSSFAIIFHKTVYYWALDRSSIGNADVSVLHFFCLHLAPTFTYKFAFDPNIFLFRIAIVF